MSNSRAAYWMIICILISLGFLVGQIAAVALGTMVAVYLAYKDMEYWHNALRSDFSNPQGERPR